MKNYFFNLFKLFILFNLLALTLLTIPKNPNMPVENTTIGKHHIKSSVTKIKGNNITVEDKLRRGGSPLI